MLVVHEVHSVRGAAMDEFEAAYRDGWMRLLADGDDARLLWYLHHAHGTGPGYTVVTVTAVRNGAAWERLALRLHQGDLHSWFSRVDGLRHEVMGKILVPVPWSPLQDVDFGAVATSPTVHPPTLYMEDTGRPHAPLDEYIGFLDEGYRRRIAGRPAEERLLDIVACFQVAHGSHDRREVVLMQRIVNLDRLLSVLATPTSERRGLSSEYMEDALRIRDLWESRLLRTSSWSPLD